MAFVAVQLSLPDRPSMANGFFVDRRRPCTIFSYTKDAGDVTASLDTKLQWCKEVRVITASQNSATATVGSGAPGTFTTELANMGSSTAGHIICIGNKPTH